MLQNRMLAWGVSEGRIASEQKPIWLLDELIEQGDQQVKGALLAADSDQTLDG